METQIIRKTIVLSVKFSSYLEQVPNFLKFQLEMKSYFQNVGYDIPKQETGSMLGSYPTIIYMDNEFMGSEFSLTLVYYCSSTIVAISKEDKIVETRTFEDTFVIDLEEKLNSYLKENYQMKQLQYGVYVR